MAVFLFLLLGGLSLETTGLPSEPTIAPSVAPDTDAAYFEYVDAKLQSIYRRLERVDENLAGSQRLVLSVLNRRSLLSDARAMLTRRLSRVYKHSFIALVDLCEFLALDDSGYDQFWPEDFFGETRANLRWPPSSRNDSEALNLTWWATHGTSTTGAHVVSARAPDAE